MSSWGLVILGACVFVCVCVCVCVFMHMHMHLTDPEEYTTFTSAGADDSKSDGGERMGQF